MKYKLELVTAASQLMPIIQKAEDRLFELRNERDDDTISVKRGLKATTRRAKLIEETNAKLAQAQADYNSRPDGVEKDKAFAEMRTQEARLLKLNIPVESSPIDDIVQQEFEKEQLELAISGAEDFVTALNARKTELEA